MSDYNENFTPAAEAQANKMLMGLSGVLMVVFFAMGLLKVQSGMTHYLWFAFGIASFGSFVVFTLASKADTAKA
jgi:hypothetical protein